MTKSELKDIIKECYNEIKNDNISINETAFYDKINGSIYKYKGTKIYFQKENKDDEFVDRNVKSDHDMILKNIDKFYNVTLKSMFPKDTPGHPDIYKCKITDILINLIVEVNGLIKYKTYMQLKNNECIIGCRFEIYSNEIFNPKVNIHYND